MVATPIGLWATLLSFGFGLISNVYTCANFSGHGLDIVLILQTMLTLFALVVAGFMALMFAGAALIVALLVASVLMRLYNVFMLEQQALSSECRP